MEYGFLSIIPPLLALVVAFKTKNAIPAIFLGVLAGCLILSSWNPLSALRLTMEWTLDTCTNKDNFKIFLFSMLMGASVYLFKVSGGVDGFLNFLGKREKEAANRLTAELMAYAIGVLIFIDGMMGIMFKGAVMLPVFDKYKIAREKLAYINHSTSSPINGIIPLNSWGAMLIGLIGTQIAAGYAVGDATALLIGSLKYQFYSMLALVFVLVVILTGKDWSFMKKAEERVRTTGKLYDDGVVPLLNVGTEDDSVVAKGRENPLNMLLPLIIIIGGTFLYLFVSGDGDLTKGDGTTSILYAVSVALVFMCFYYTRQKIMSVREFSGYLYRGVSRMISLMVLLALAFTIGAVVSRLGTGVFLAGLLSGHVSGALLPAIVFIMGAIISFCIGTAWGTFSILMPIALPMAAAMGADVYVTIGAVVSSGIFGNHCSPIADTSILSAMTSGLDLMSHIKTQMPYALFCAALATVMFVIVGHVI